MDEAASFVSTLPPRSPQGERVLAAQVEKAKVEATRTTMFGRRRGLPELVPAGLRLPGIGRTRGLNAPIQGSAANSQFSKRR